MKNTATRTGTADLPLHYGSAPRWLFQRMAMARLARELSLALAQEMGAQELLRRLADPFWFHSLGCLLGFDWHSSGLTTTLTAALKEGLRGIEDEIGLYAAGGKGRASRQTPQELLRLGDRAGIDPSPLIYASRMAAKVDSAALQDGYQLYHHAFFLTRNGSWAVVQQGMNEATRYARRYHWLGERVTDFVCEPHSAILSDAIGTALNLVARESAPARRAIPLIASQEKPEVVAQELERLKRLSLPAHHPLTLEDISPRHLERVLLSTYERQPEDFERLLALPGVGAKTVRALALLSEVLYGAPPSFRDPARYSFAHGGKDGYPYPVDREGYDRTIEVLTGAVRRAKLGDREKLDALRRLAADSYQF